MHWLDKEIVVVEIDGRFFALNGWDGECYSRCWECGDRRGDTFHKVVGVDTYKITPRFKDEFVLEKNPLIGTMDDIKEQMYKSLLPYMGQANTISGEILRAVQFIEHSITKNTNISGALKFLSLNLDDDLCSILIDEIRNNDFENFSVLKQKVENIVLKQYENNELEINYDDFEDMND
ncbi:hypothetical protein [Campylobacter fetus]|uniref:hypothetical protein n=1 Tax=Campylobacter fetus TaxID=196 RepID=UPI0013D060AE|nr:hypothetical protein [Campylobacter fetus]